MPLANSQFQSDIEFYVGKIDTLFLDKSGQLVLQEGEQTENPIRPGDLATGLRMYDLRIQPFCLHAKTNIKLKKYDYFRYGMKEIHGLDKRIARLEDVVTSVSVGTEDTEHDSQGCCHRSGQISRQVIS